MLVKILDFGSNWWARFGDDTDDPFRFTRHAAYFNSTGLRCGKKMRRHWVIPGMIRFNGTLNGLTRGHTHFIGTTLECADLKVAFGGNRLLVFRQVPKFVTPDYYLLLLSGENHGTIDFAHDWKSESTLPIAVSSFRTRYEALVLMKMGGWIPTALGRWQLLPGKDRDGSFLRLGQ